MPNREVSRGEFLAAVGTATAVVVVGGVPLAFNVNEFLINSPHPEKTSGPSWSEEDQQHLSTLANRLSPYIGIAEEMPFENDTIARAIVGFTYQWRGLEEAKGVVTSLTNTPPIPGEPHKSIIFRPMTKDEAGFAKDIGLNDYTKRTGKDATKAVGYETITVDTPTGSFVQNVFEVHPQFLSLLRDATDTERQAFTPAFMASAFGELIDVTTNEQLKSSGKGVLIFAGSIVGGITDWTAGAVTLSYGQEILRDKLQVTHSRRDVLRALFAGDVLATTGVTFVASGFGSIINMFRLIGNMMAQQQLETGDTLLLTPDGKIAVNPKQGFVTSNPQLLNFVGKLIQ